MSDNLSSEKRRKVMASIKGKDTRPEMLLWAQLDHRIFHRYPRIQGNPDIGCVSRKIAIFVDGCFWHGCPLCYRPPSTRPEYWSNKLKRNLENDERVNIILKMSGFKVLRYWEHEVLSDAEACVQRVNEVLD
ncbi:MAG: very short patch repair endonuclease [Candidatus Thermoplasmatota archaeon]|nr:very short patch repair endonuclease [Candidatus Thermoplasmatota archaeon]